LVRYIGECGYVYTFPGIPGPKNEGAVEVKIIGVTENS
jgi:hypothetical protein